MVMHRVSFIGLVGLTLAGTAGAAPIVFSGTGSNAASLQTVVDSFRAALGGANNGVGGTFATGRREINWDAPALDAFASPSLMPADFFNPVSPPPGSPRGASFSTPGTGFLVSQRAEVGGADNVRFGDIDPSYDSIFQTFSSQRLFAAQGSTITDVHFFIPGSPTSPGTVKGFGAVFADVDDDASTYLEFFDVNNNLVHSQSVSPQNNGLSFLGVSFDAGEQIARVRITAGNTPMGAGVLDGFDDIAGFQDIVVMDDFIYGEPVPAPGAAMIAVLGAGFLARRRRN